ncbi:unnamed protein product [Paramecium sonneborni]|uniref:Uncharacterized protein n=1 Tax=Paramecium sonneborni TaxID=65129 RepID=A0A8S1RCA1_9CILI|nr:unnamed protein product [Paramecium sonneborni]
MLKSITRRRKKYIFLDYMIVLLTSLYIRIRTVDIDFYSSLQPNYTWLLTIVFGLMFAKIGRVWCILICSIMNISSIYFLSNSSHVVFVSSIYIFTYENLILLIFCHSLNVFREKAFQGLLFCYAFGNYLELAQVFLNLKYLKYLLFILIISLSVIRLKFKQLPQTNYFIVIKHVFTVRMAITQAIMILFIMQVIINLRTFLDMIGSSSTRYFALILFPLICLVFFQYEIMLNEGFFLSNFTLSILLLFDQFAIFFIAAGFLCHALIIQVFAVFYVFDQIDSKISRTYKNLNYDIIVLIHYAILKYFYAHYDSYAQHKNIIQVLSGLISIFLIIRARNLCRCFFKNKQNYYNNTYDQFESARNDDTVL